ARKSIRHSVECRFGPSELIGCQQLVWHAEFLEHLDVSCRRLELLARAKELQRAGGTLVVADTGFFTQRAQTVAAVFREAKHSLLIDRVAPARAIRQHRGEPLQLVPSPVGFDG